MSPVVSGRAKRPTANRIAGLLFVLGLVLVLCVGGILWYAGTRGPKTSGLSATASGSASASLKLAWDRSPSTKVVGYRILSGTQSGTYIRSMEVGNETTGMLGGLTTGTKYYVVVVAVDAQGNQSAPSNEIEIAVPK
jgi:hypothetical protein